MYSFFILAVSEVTIRKVADCLNSLLFSLAFSLSSFSPLSSPPEIVDTRETVYKEASKLSYKKVCVKQGKNLWQQLSSLFNEKTAAALPTTFSNFFSHFLTGLHISHNLKTLEVSTKPSAAFDIQMTT